jgi:hypothetical protein
MSSTASEITAASNNADFSSGDWSGERDSELSNNYSKVMYERWQKAN